MGRMCVLLPALAGSLLACGQNSFVVHFDSVQNGLPGQPRGVVEVDGGFLLCGTQFSDDTTGRIHLFLRRTDHNGMVQINNELFRNVDKTYQPESLGALVTLDSSYASITTISDPYTWETKISFLELDPDGDTLRVKDLIHFGPQDSVIAFIRQTVRTNDTGFAGIGAYDPIDTPAQALLLRCDAQGDTLWTRRLGYLSTSEDGWSLCELPDHGFALSVVHSGGGPSDDHTLIRTDSLGHQLWRVQYGEYGWGVPSVRLSPDSTLITLSDHKMDLGSSAWQEIELRKWNLTGSVIWSKFSHRTPNSNTAPRDFEVLPNGSIVCSISYGRTAMIAKFDASGDSLWSHFYYVFSETNNYNEAIINDIDQTSDGGFVMCGWKIQDQGDPTDGLQTWFLIKTDSLGCGAPGCQTLGVNEFVIGLQEYLKIFPNPVAPGHTATVELAPPGGADLGPVELVVQDVMGREVSRENMVRTGGVSSFSFPVSAFSPGTYLLHVVGEGKWLAGGKLLVE